MALAAPPIVSFIISLMLLPVVSWIYSFAKEKDLLEEKSFGIVLYVTCYLLTLYLTVMLLQIFVRVFNINSIELVQFLLQTVAFSLFVVVFCVFRDPKQLQYVAYAIGYGLFIVWEWAVSWKVLGDSLLGIDIEFALKFFIIPFKEAMLSFIIYDTYLKAKEELKAKKALSAKSKTSAQTNKHKKRNRK